jgi:hypothetical protein
MAHMATQRRAGWRSPVAAKVPEITFLFWVLKLLTTAGGEAFSDYLALHGDAVAGAVEILIFLAAVALQFWTRRYVAVAYWFLALAIAIFGTGVADAPALRGRHPDSGCGLAVRAERGARVLVCLRDHPAARRLVRGLPQQAD